MILLIDIIEQENIKLVKRNQLLSAKQNTITIDEYVTSLHNIARECQLDTMYYDFMS